jgi:ankyrin repeat protein
LLFLKAGKLEMQNRGGANSLVKATVSGNSEEVTDLLDRGLNPDVPGHLGLTALMLGCKSGHLNIVKLLIERGAKADARDDLQRTPLMFAAFGGNPDIVRLILAQRIDPNATDGTGRTALIYSAIRNNAEAASLLIQSGANPHHIDKNSRTADDWGGQKFGADWRKLVARLPQSQGQRIKLSRVIWLSLLLVVAAQAIWWLAESINAKDEFKISQTGPLVTLGELVHVYDPHHRGRPLPPPLLTLEGSVPRLPGEGMRRVGKQVPVHMVQFQLLEGAKRCCQRVVQNCLNSNLNPNIKDSKGRTPLSLAAENDCFEVAKMLLDPRRPHMLRADVNARDNEGRTPLMWACSRGNYDLIDLLLSKGADRGARDRNGNTPLAYMQEHFKTVK